MSEPRTLDPPADLHGPRYREAIRQGQRGLADAQQLRDMLLAHKDLAQRLTAPPLHYSAPGNWNGYIPPLTTCAEAGQRNNSPQRRALIELVAEAMRREYGQESAAAWKWTTG